MTTQGKRPKPQIWGNFCVCCGTMFDTTVPNKCTCGAQCKAKLARRVAEIQCRCRNCGEYFAPSKKRGSEFCRKKCGDEARRKAEHTQSILRAFESLGASRTRDAESGSV